MSVVNSPGFSDPTGAQTAPTAWTDDELSRRLAETTDAGERCRLLLAWDTGLPLVKLDNIELERLLTQAGGWGHQTTVSVGGQEYLISHRSIAAISEWLVADRAPEHLQERQRERETLRALEAKGYRVVFMDDCCNWIAESDPMTLGEAAQQFARWDLTVGCKIAVLPPGAGDDYV